MKRLLVLIVIVLGVLGNGNAYAFQTMYGVHRIQYQMLEDSSDAFGAIIYDAQFNQLFSVMVYRQNGNLFAETKPMQAGDHWDMPIGDTLNGAFRAVYHPKADISEDVEVFDPQTDVKYIILLEDKKIRLEVVLKRQGETSFNLSNKVDVIALPSLGIVNNDLATTKSMYWDTYHRDGK